MRAAINCSSARGLLPSSVLLLLLLLLDRRAYAQLDVGSRCTMSRQRFGSCQLIQNCQSVYNDLLKGNKPEVVCGHHNGSPVVCCPDVDLGISESSGCNLRQGSGVCRLLNECQSVYNDLIAGRRPEKICSFQGSTPVVCCPTNGNRPAPTFTNGPVWDRQTTTTTTTRRPSIPLSNARPARRMCAQYAKSLYELESPPALAGGDEQLVNVSLCAITNKKLIVGGTKAEPKEFPYMAAVGYSSGSTVRWDCGGTLISESFILTAAHCLTSPQWGAAQWARVGDLNTRQSNDNARPQDRRITQRIPHPNYRRPAQYNDIALLKLQQPVTFNAYVRPACLDLKGNHRAGEKSVATGWGIVDWYDESGSEDLLKVVLPVVAQANCQGFYADDTNRLPNGIDVQTQLCAGETGKDTCQGDSGGPLAVYSTDEECMYDVIGVTSFGQLCGSVSPGIYTRVYSYLNWIEGVVWPNLK